jgi:hypothetical protein
MDRNSTTLTDDEVEEAVIDLTDEVISAGYMQLECNNEGLTDLGDAIRIVVESNYPKLDGPTSMKLHEELRLSAEAGWQREFGANNETA